MTESLGCEATRPLRSTPRRNLRNTWRATDPSPIGSPVWWVGYLLDLWAARCGPTSEGSRKAW